MTFKDLLEGSTTNPKYALFLGMIYGFPIAKNGYIEAFAEIIFDNRAKVVNQLFSKNELLTLNIENNTAIRQFTSGTEIRDSDIVFDSSDKFWRCSVKFKDTDLFDSENEHHRALIYGMIEKSLMDFSMECKNYFISGMFNARGSLDFTTGFFAIDIEVKRFPQFVKRKYFAISNLVGAFYNYNPRLLQEIGKSKSDQLRPKIDLFVSVFGLLLPFKKQYFEKVRNVKMTKENSFYFYKTDVSKIKDFQGYARGLEINKLTIDFQNKLITEDDLLRIRVQLGLDNDHDDLDTLLHANPNVKDARKKMYNFECEINNAHRTFTAKVNSLPFVEGHHLIPFGKRREFAVNIDIVENIVALCPVCHRQIHLAIDNERFELLDKLYDKNVNGLRNAGLDITRNQLFEFYK